MTYIKDFDGWHPIKKDVNERSGIPTFKQREIWWCSTGVNVGVEQDGKNEHFERPVLIVRKFNRRLFWGIPLSTQIKEFPHHFVLEFKARKETEARARSFIISQMRALDSSRLTRPLGKLAPEPFQLIMNEVKGVLD